MKICAVIPAAGRGSRLGFDVPKILAPIAGKHTIWDVLKEKLLPLVDHIHVILSPSGLSQFEAVLSADDRRAVSTGVQESPVGMGDAVFCGFPVWKDADHILVLWSDQVHVSFSTLQQSIEAHLAEREFSLTMPLVSLEQPYVEYRFDEQGGLLCVLQSREGDLCAPGGLGDVGTFLLSTRGLAEQWDRYCKDTPPGASTGERNFLPFLVFLSRQGWKVNQVPVADPNEARGINTQEDLAFFQSLYRREI